MEMKREGKSRRAAIRLAGWIFLLGLGKFREKYSDIFSSIFADIFWWIGSEEWRKRLVKGVCSFILERV